MRPTSISNSTRCRRRRSTLLAGATVAGLLLAPSVAGAVGANTLTSPWAFEGPGQVFCGTYTGTLVPADTGEHSCDIAGYMIGADVGGDATAVYSTRADMAAGDTSSTATLEDFPAEGSDFGANDDTARRVLVNYFPNENPGLDEAYQLGGTDDEKAAAVQAALWTLAGDYTMDLDTEPGDLDETDFVTFANYLHIMEAVDDGALPDGLEDLYVHIVGPAEGTIDSYTVGPFTVATNGSAVTIDPPADTEVVDAGGTPMSLVFRDGEQFYLDVPGLGDYEITATTQGIQDASVRAWTTESALAATQMPLADGFSIGGSVSETLPYTVYLIQAAAATPVQTDPAFTG